VQLLLAKRVALLLHKTSAQWKSRKKKRGMWLAGRTWSRMACEMSARWFKRGSWRRRAAGQLGEIPAQHQQERE